MAYSESQAFGLLISDHEHGQGLLKSKHVSEKF
jgi:hypothetical protein